VNNINKISSSLSQNVKRKYIKNINLIYFTIDCMSHWKALTLWKNPNYLNKIAGSRTVPIEIGSSYTEEDWTQHLVNFSEFLQKHVIASNSEIGYLAQHQLFEQVILQFTDAFNTQSCHKIIISKSILDTRIKRRFRSARILLFFG